MKQIFIIIFLTIFSLNSYSQSSFLNGEPSWSPDGDKIVFISKRDGNNEVYIMNSDGSSQTRLTNTQSSESEPSFSPDGEKILFHSDKSGVTQVYVMNTDGSNQINITNTDLPEINGTWSPTGKKIAFTSVRNNNAQVYIMNPDGTDQERLVFTETNVSRPIWSENENKIACLSFEYFKKISENLQISLIDKSVEKIFTDTTEKLFFNDWSKDLSNILYKKTKVYSYSESYSELFISDTKFENTKRIYKINDRIISAKFSPEEDKVLIYTPQSVIVLFLETGKIVKVGKKHHSPKWSLDGKTIVMVSSSRMNIFTVNPDGENLNQLTFKKGKKKK